MTVTFAHSKKVVAWDDIHGSLLELAEAQGLRPEFSCRAGICSTCVCELLSGQVSYFTEPLEEPEPGLVLICCSRPLGDVSINI